MKIVDSTLKFWWVDVEVMRMTLPQQNLELSRIHTFKRKVRGEQQPIQLVSEGRQDRLTS